MFTVMDSVLTLEAAVGRWLLWCFLSHDLHQQSLPSCHGIEDVEISHFSVHFKDTLSLLTATALPCSPFSSCSRAFIIMSHDLFQLEFANLITAQQTPSVGKDPEQQLNGHWLRLFGTD